MAQFITAAEIVTYVGLGSNFNTDLIKTYLIEASQQRNILPILKQDFYDILVTQNDASTLTAVNTTLMNTYIKPCLAFFTVHGHIPYWMVEMRNTGLMVNNTEYSFASDMEKISNLRAQLLIDANEFKDKMIRFIEHEDQSGDYPLYYGDGTSNTASFGGWIIS